MMKKQSDNKQLYLISGFLGCGKTTLLKNLITLFSDRKIAVIVNEFGKQDVDGALLSETGAQVNKINNGSIFCACRSDIFIDVLSHAMRSDADVVLVETSGLSDPSGIDLILHSVGSITDEIYDFCGTICVVECARLLKLIHNVVAIKQQILSAGLILINKMDISAPNTVEEAIACITGLNPAAVIHKTSFSNVDKVWLEDLKEAQSQITPGTGRHTLGIKNLFFTIDSQPSYAAFYDWLKQIAGETYRVKGFADLEEGRYLIDCVGTTVSMTPAENRGPSYVVILSGSGDKAAAFIENSYKQMQNTSGQEKN